MYAPLCIHRSLMNIFPLLFVSSFLFYNWCENKYTYTLSQQRGRSVVHACHNLAEDMTVCTTMSEDHGMCQKSERGLVVQTSWCVGGHPAICARNNHVQRRGGMLSSVQRQVRCAKRERGDHLFRQSAHVIIIYCVLAWAVPCRHV